MARKIFPGGRGRASGPKVSLSKNLLLNFNAAAAEQFKIKVEDQFAVYFDDEKGLIELERPGKGEQISGGLTARGRKVGLSVYFSMAGALSFFGLDCPETQTLSCELKGETITLDVSSLPKAKAEAAPKPKV